MPPSELAGLPEDFIAAHPPGADGLVTINTTTPDYSPVMSYATSDKLRRDLSEIYNRRAFPVNDEKLREMLKLRQQLAEKLSRRNYAQLDARRQNGQHPEEGRDCCSRTWAMPRCPRPRAITRRTSPC